MTPEKPQEYSRELFSQENTAHLNTPEDEERYKINMMQMAWVGVQTEELSEEEFALRSQWFREEFLEQESYASKRKNLFAHLVSDESMVGHELEKLYRARTRH